MSVQKATTRVGDSLLASRSSGHQLGCERFNWAQPPAEPAAMVKKNHHLAASGALGKEHPFMAEPLTFHPWTIGREAVVAREYDLPCLLSIQ